MENMDMDHLENFVEEIIEDWLFIDSSSDESTSDSESSDDEGRGGPPEKRKCVKRFVEDTVNTYSDIEFKNHFRLSRQTAYNLIERFRQSIFLANNEPQENAITHERAMLMTLWYLANTETFRQIADRFDLSRSSTHNVLNSTINFINSLCEEFIRWPIDENEKIAISQGFSRRRNINHVIGAIDGCHIQIRRPVVDANDYFNRKKIHSIVLQAMVTSKKNFTDVYIGEPGSMHDARVLRRSSLYERAQNDREFFGNYFILGDSAYPNLPWLVPTFKDNGRLTHEQRVFNFRHSSTRVHVEQTFGLLRGKFRRLMRFDNLRLDLIVRCIMAACILHNICILSDNESDYEDEDNSGNDDNADERLDMDENENEILNFPNRRMVVFNQMFGENIPTYLF